jgi:hypothetical protein
MKIARLRFIEPLRRVKAGTANAKAQNETRVAIGVAKNGSRRRRFHDGIFARARRPDGHRGGSAAAPVDATRSLSAERLG